MQETCRAGRPEYTHQDAIDSDRRVTALLSRLIGLAGAQLHDDLSEAALRAAAALCDFDAGHALRTQCLTAAAAVAAGSGQVSVILINAIRCARRLDVAGRDMLGCMLDVALTLLEGASVQGGPPPEGEAGIVYVTGQHGWIHEDRWVFTLARTATVFGVKWVISPSSHSPGNLQRNIVVAAAIACEPQPPSAVDVAARLFRDFLSVHVPFFATSTCCMSGFIVVICALPHPMRSSPNCPPLAKASHPLR